MDTEADPGSPSGEAPGVSRHPRILERADETPALTPPSTEVAPPVAFPSPSTVASPAVVHPETSPVFVRPARAGAARAAWRRGPGRRSRSSSRSRRFPLSLAADLATKAWAKGHLSGAGTEPRAHNPRKLDIWKGHVDFIFAQNPGGAWSFLRGLPDSLRRPFFLVVSAAAIVFIVSIYQRVYRDQTTMKWGLPLALGGAMGNLADRIRYGWVVDFVDVYVTQKGHEHHWPTFNVADIAIVVGVVLMAIDMMRSRSRAHHDAAHAPGLSGAPTPAGRRRPAATRLCGGRGFVVNPPAPMTEEAAPPPPEHTCRRLIVPDDDRDSPRPEPEAPAERVAPDSLPPASLPRPAPIQIRSTGDDGGPLQPVVAESVRLPLPSSGGDVVRRSRPRSRHQGLGQGEPRHRDPHVFPYKKIEVVTDHLYFTFTPRTGAARGACSRTRTESVRRPFFVLISIAAIAFIVSLYRKLTPPQWALRWGLPLVLGGALGNLVNRIQYNHVVDFIVYRADWIVTCSSGRTTGRRSTSPTSPSSPASSSWPSTCSRPARRRRQRLRGGRGPPQTPERAGGAETPPVDAAPEPPRRWSPSPPCVRTSSASSRSASRRTSFCCCRGSSSRRRSERCGRGASARARTSSSTSASPAC